MLKTENVRLAFKSFQLVVVQVVCATLGFLFPLLFSLRIGGADHWKGVEQFSVSQFTYVLFAYIPFFLGARKSSDALFFFSASLYGTCKRTQQQKKKEEGGLKVRIVWLRSFCKQSQNDTPESEERVTSYVSFLARQNDKAALSVVSYGQGRWN